MRWCSFPARSPAPVKQGQVRLLAALTQKRDPALPEVPTAQEQGVDVVARSLARHRRAARHAARRDRRARERDPRTVELGGVREGSENLGVRPAFMPADEFGELIAKEDAELARLMQASA